ncbi:hypothetical protein HZA87_02520 [Candidatus Uhrbacteria bacterium]|nr:hypothetical protein [Candidatus Uhrbacteria bacterium]
MPTKKTTTKKRVAVKKPGPTIVPIDIHEPGAMPLMIYRRIAVTFVFVVSTVLVAVLYLSTMQAVIHVTSVQTPITTSFVVAVRGTGVENAAIAGRVVSGTLGKTQTITPSTDEASMKDVEGVATGSVTIYNGLTFDQGLVATTRLLSSEGVLFRLEDAVTVPSGGSVQAEVYADEPGASGDILPTKFTIPGLSAIRQASVYAESLEAFTGGITKVAIVSQEDIDEAVAQVQASLESDAQSMLETEVGDAFSWAVYSTAVQEQTVSIEPGSEAASFDVTLGIKVVGVFYDRPALESIAVHKLYEGLGQGQAFVSVDPSMIELTLDTIHEQDQEANVHVSFSANAITSTTNNALDVSRFVGMSERGVVDLLVGEGVATAVDVKFFPFWISHVPRLKDHIYIEIQ